MKEVRVFSKTSSLTSWKLQGDGVGVESKRQETNVRWICEEVSDTPAYYHANCMVNVIIGKTNLAGSNYRGKTDNFWGFSAHKIVFNGPLFPLWMPNNNALLMNLKCSNLEREKVTWYQRGLLIKKSTARTVSWTKNSWRQKWKTTKTSEGGLPEGLHQCTLQCMAKSMRTSLCTDVSFGMGLFFMIFN